jgi:PadR family transcriptional regulator, regulatory protein PadR
VRQIKPQDYYAPILGEFELLVLLALVRLGNGAYGASIRREIRERTGRDVSAGTAYMTLGRLEEKKMIASYIGLPTAQRGGRRRKHYLIDKDGERALGRAHRALIAMSEGFQAELDRL